MKKIVTVIISLTMLSALVFGCSSGSGKDEDDRVYEVIFSSQEPDTSLHSQNVMNLWANKVEEVTNGRVKFVYYWSSSISGIPELLDNLESGAVHAAWSATSAYMGRYTAISGIMMPGLGLKTSADGAEAVWNWLHEPEPSQEWQPLVLAATYPNGDIVINNSIKEIKTAEDFYGLRLRAMNSAWQAVFEDIGAVSMSFGMNDTYENLEKNVADGLVQDYNFLAWSRIFEVSPYCLDRSLAINISLMYWSPVFLDSLPDDLREAVLSVGGLELSRACGAAIEQNDVRMKQAFIDGGGVVYPPTDEVVTALENGFPAGVENWIRECNAKGYNGDELYERLLRVTAPYITG